MTGTHAYMLADLGGSLAAVAVYPLFTFIPGYVVAWLLDLFEFRRRTFVGRFVVSVPLSIAVCPVAVYLAGRFLSMGAVWTLFIGLWAAFAILLLRGKVPFSRVPRWAVTLTAAWLAVALLASVDLQFGGRLYYPVSAFDYCMRTEIIQAIARTGIPPATPFFSGGPPVPLRYHYFWLLICTLVQEAGAALIGPRCAWIGGVFWSGMGLMTVVAAYLRFFWNRSSSDASRRTRIGILLLAVTGLDIIPTAILWFFKPRGMAGPSRPAWSGGTSRWTGSAIRRSGKRTIWPVSSAV